MLQKIKSMGKDRTVVDKECPIKLLQDSGPVLEEVMPYFNLFGLASLMKTSSEIRQILKTVLETVAWKSFPSTFEQALCSDVLSARAAVRVNDDLFVSLFKWLVKFTPSIQLWEEKENPLFDNVTRSVIRRLGIEAGLDVLGKFKGLYSISLEIDCLTSPIDYHAGLKQFVGKNAGHTELRYLEIAGQEWRDSLRGSHYPTEHLAVYNMSSPLPFNERGRLSDKDQTLNCCSIFIFIRDDVDLSRNRIIAEKLAGTTEYDEKRKKFDWKHFGRLNITKLTIQMLNEAHFIPVLEQCMELTTDLKLISTQGKTMGEPNGELIPKYITDTLNLAQYLEETHKRGRLVKMSEVLGLPTLRIFNECNQYFRKYLEREYLCEESKGSQEKRVEIFRVNNRDDPYKDVEVLVLAESLSGSKSFLPPQNMTFYQPHYLHTNLAAEDIAAIRRLTGLKRVWIRRPLSGYEDNGKAEEILGVVKEALSARNKELDELRIGTLPEHVFVNRKHYHSIKSGKDSRWGPDTYTYYPEGATSSLHKNLWQRFPYLRLYKHNVPLEEKDVMRLSFKDNQLGNISELRRVTVNKDCPIKVLQASRSVLDALMPYLDLFGLASFLKTSRTMRNELKPVMGNVRFYKRISKTIEKPDLIYGNGQTSPEANAITAIGNDEILTSLILWLARFMPQIQPGWWHDEPSFGDLTRAITSRQGLEGAMVTIKKFESITSLALEMDEKRPRSDYHQGLDKHIRDGLRQLEYMEIAGQPWKNFRDINQLVTWNLSKFLREGRKGSPFSPLSFREFLPQKTSIHIFMRDDMDPTLTERLSGLSVPMELGENRRKSFGWKHFGGLRVSELTIRNPQRFQTLEQCMELNMVPDVLDLGKYEDGKYFGIAGKYKGDEVPRYVAENLHLVSHLDKSVRIVQGFETVAEMMGLPLVRIFNQCNQCFRKRLQEILDDMERKYDKKTKEKRLEIFRINNRSDPYGDVEVLVYAPSLIWPKTKLPPSSMTFYQPYYVHEELTKGDIDALKKLTGLKRVWIRHDPNKGVSHETVVVDLASLAETNSVNNNNKDANKSPVDDERIRKIVKEISEVLKDAKTELDELRMGFHPEVVFVNVKHIKGIKSGKDRRWGPDNYRLYPDGSTDFEIFGVFPKLRLVKTIKSIEEPRISPLSFRPSQ